MQFLSKAKAPKLNEKGLKLDKNLPKRGLKVDLKWIKNVYFQFYLLQDQFIRKCDP